MEFLWPEHYFCVVYTANEAYHVPLDASCKLTLPFFLELFLFRFDDKLFVGPAFCHSSSVGACPSNIRAGACRKSRTHCVIVLVLETLKSLWKMKRRSTSGRAFRRLRRSARLSARKNPLASS